MHQNDLDLNYVSIQSKKETNKVFTEECGNSLHFDRFNQSTLQQEFILLTILLQLPSFFLFDVVSMSSGVLTQLIAGIIVVIFQCCTCKQFFHNSRTDSIFHTSRTPKEITTAVFGSGIATTNRVIIIIQYLIYIFLNIMLTRRCVSKIFWDNDSVFWQSCVSFAVVCAILLLIINIGIAKFFSASYLIPLQILFMFIFYNAVELGIYISQDNNYVKITQSGIQMYTSFTPQGCRIPFIKFNQEFYSDLAEALTFWLNIYSIPSFTMRLPYSHAKKLHFRRIIINVFIIVACCSIIYLPWTICSHDSGLQAIQDYLDNTMKQITYKITLKVMLGLKSLQQMLMITLFGRYVLYEIIDIYKEQKGQSTEEIRVSGLRWYFSIFIIIITMVGFVSNYREASTSVVLIPFRINSVLIICSSYLLPLVYYQIDTRSVNLNNTFHENESDDLFNVEIDADVSVDFYRKDSSYLMSTDMNKTMERKYKKKGARKAKVNRCKYNSKRFFAICGIFFSVILGVFLIVDQVLCYVQSSYTQSFSGSLIDN